MVGYVKGRRWLAVDDLVRIYRKASSVCQLVLDLQPCKHTIAGDADSWHTAARQVAARALAADACAACSQAMEAADRAEPCFCICLVLVLG